MFFNNIIEFNGDISLNWKEEAKRKTAIESVKLVKDGFVVGLGTGSTSSNVIKEIGRRIREEGLNILAIPTSNKSKDLAIDCDIPLTTLDKNPSPDIAIDGADQVDPKINLIKGMGGALTREKIVDSAAKSLVIVVDASKMTKNLGTGQPVPVEILPFALKPAMPRLRNIGGNPRLRYSSRNCPFKTDNGNYVVDVDFGSIDNPENLEKEINNIPGVIENGLFIDIADIVYVGYEEEVKKIYKS